MTLRRIFFIILVVLALMAFVLLASRNSGNVPIDLVFANFQAPKILLIMLPFILGLLVLTFFVADTKRSLSALRQSAQIKRKEKIDDYLQQARQAMISGKFQEAIDWCKKILRIEPWHLDANLEFGRIYRKQSNYEQAIKVHTRAKDVEEDNLEVLFELAEDYHGIGRNDDAIFILEKILRLDPENISALLKIRDIAIFNQRWELAREHQQALLKLAKILPNSAEEQQKLIGIQYEMGKALSREANTIDDGIKLLKEVVKSDRHFTPAYLKLGDLFLNAKNDFEEALKVFEAGYQAKPAAILLEKMENACIENNNPQKIVEIFKNYVNKAPQDLLAKIFLGKLYLRLEMIEDAASLIHNLQADPKISKIPLLTYMTAQVYERQKDLNAALSEYKKLFSVQPQANIAYYNCEKCHKKAVEWQDYCLTCRLWGTFILQLDQDLPTAMKTNYFLPTSLSTDFTE